MLPAEASWLGRQIQALEPNQISPMLNVGSSTGAFVKKTQPWIEQHVFGPLRRQKTEVLNIDIKPAPGVDWVGDLSDPSFLRRLSAMNFKSALCCNLLEHVPNREQIAHTLLSVVAPGGYLFISGPYRYPFHADPIDTMFRPTPDELGRLFPGTRVVASDIVNAGNYWAYVTRSPQKLAKSVVRLLLPFYRPRDWYSSVRRLGWLNRDFEAVCLVLQKL